MYGGLWSPQRSALSESQRFAGKRLGLGFELLRATQYGDVFQIEILNPVKFAEGQSKFFLLIPRA